jgi:hypothetical protein
MTLSEIVLVAEACENEFLKGICNGDIPILTLISSFPMEG